MSTFEKAKERLRSLPSDYTYSEAKTILLHKGTTEDLYNKLKELGELT